MHFDVLVEDQSGKKMLEVIIPKIIGKNHTIEIIAYCGTWECLADAVYRGGSSALSAEGWQTVGREKSRWAENIGRHMNVANNKSPSFNYFRAKLLELAK